MNFRKEMHEEAVSPVIGVILMVAITVVLAAVVGMYVMNQAEAIPDSKSVTLTAEKSVASDDDSNEVTKIKVTVVGGSDLNALQSLTLKWDGGDLLDCVSYNDAETPESKGIINGGDDGFTPGDVITIECADDKKSGKLTISGKFSDGSEALLLTKDF